MKKTAIIFAALMTVSTLSYANPHNFRHHGHHHAHRHVHRMHSIDWVAPLVIGSVVGYAIASRPDQQPQPQIIVQTPPLPPMGFRYEQILDANCNCYRLVLVPN